MPNLVFQRRSNYRLEQTTVGGQSPLLPVAESWFCSESQCFLHKLAARRLVYRVDFHSLFFQLLAIASWHALNPAIIAIILLSIGGLLAEMRLIDDDCTAQFCNCIIQKWDFYRREEPSMEAFRWVRMTFWSEKFWWTEGIGWHSLNGPDYPDFRDMNYVPFALAIILLFARLLFEKYAYRIFLNCRTFRHFQTLYRFLRLIILRFITFLSYK